MQDEPLASPVSAGEIVAGKYRVERVLGVGGMGVVVSARHTTLEQVVAIKFLVANRFDTHEEAVGRFLAEARAAARIESDYVCRVSDVGMLDSGVPFMVMEHLDGRDLDEEIAQRGQLSIVEAVDFVLQAADALAAAHQLGIVHRDIKPANLFLAVRPDGTRRVKVLDFGISKAAGLDAPRSTLAAASSMGTPAYMSPEQVRAASDVDARTDIWGLGAILYELVTGQMAFVGDDVRSILDHVMNGDPCPMSALRRDVPPELETIVMTCLDRDRDRRWPSAARFARALAPFGSPGIFQQLASVQRELGSITSISALRSSASASSLRSNAAHSVEPMVANVRSSVPTMPDPTELLARESIVQDWSNLRVRKRNARVAVLALAAIASLVATVGVLMWLSGGGAAGTRNAAEKAAAGGGGAPVAAESGFPGAAISPGPAGTGTGTGTGAGRDTGMGTGTGTVTNETRDAAMAASAPAAPPNVHAASSNVQSARTAQPRAGAQVRGPVRPAPKASVNHLLDTRD